MTQEKEITVIGAGPGGYAAAFYAADLGMSVTLIDPDANPGGVCLFRGCIPSKALLHVAKVLHDAKALEPCGVHFSKPKINLEKLRTWKEGVVNQLTGGLGQLAKNRKIHHIRGRAKFLSETLLEIELIEGTKTTHAFQHCILATGSRPAHIPTLAASSQRIMDSTTALALQDIPTSLLIVGGGYIGLEMGTVYASLGSEVSVVEMMPGLLPGADRDLVKVLQKKLDSTFKSIMLETKLVSANEVDDGIEVAFESKNGATITQKFEKILVSVGRKPNLENLGLENTKIQLTQRGFVKINAQRQTDEPTIYAIGDVAGEPMLAHKASHEGRTAVEAIAGHKVVFEPRAIPGVVFTDPEVAWAGLTEAEAKEANISIQVARFPWAASGRALTMDRTDGLTKLIVEPETERILGIGIVGPNAGEMIAEGVLAMEMGANATDLQLTIHPHPTLSETIMETAEMLHGTSTHIYRPKRSS